MRRGRRAVRSQGIPKHGRHWKHGARVLMGLLEDDAHIPLGALGASYVALTFRVDGGGQQTLPGTGAIRPSWKPWPRPGSACVLGLPGEQASTHSSDAAGCLGRSQDATPGLLRRVVFYSSGAYLLLSKMYTLEN